MDASGRQSVMVRSMDADSRQGASACPTPASPLGPGGCGCQAAEKTQSSCPTSTAPAVAVKAPPATAKLGCGAYLHNFKH